MSPPVGISWNHASAIPRVRGQMHGVPELVRQSCTRDRERAPRDRQQQHGADGGSDHAGERTLADHHPELARERTMRRHRVSPDLQHDVHDHEIDAEVAVPAVPVRQAVEAGETLEHRQPREQNDLHEREIRSDQPRQAGGAGEHVARRMHQSGCRCRPRIFAIHRDVAEVDRPGADDDDVVRRPCARTGSRDRVLS